MRAFVALDLDGESLARIARVAEVLRAARGAPRATWVAADRMHLTMKFLGEIDPPVAAALGDTLPTLAAAEPRPALVARAITAFPSERKARVLVLAMDDTGGAALPLASALEARAEALGVPRETRPFKAHVTLARIKLPVDARRWLAGAAVDVTTAVGACAVTQLALYESELGPRGPTYRVLARAPYGDAPAG